MLTRIEVDGFKNLLGFSAEFGPFTCIAGPNAVGKSNLFDAIEFLSLLADLPVKDAAKRIRGGGEVRDLFYANGNRRVERMRFAVEVLTENVVTDDRGQTSPPVGGLYRYEITVGFESGNADLAAPLSVINESLRFHTQDPEQLRFPGAERIREKLLTVPASSQLIFQRSPEGSTPLARTYVGTQTTIDQPHALAVRRELQSWRRLALDPAAIRRSDSIDDQDKDITAEGKHLAATIYRLAHASHDGHPPDPDGFYAQLAVRLADLLSVRSLRVDRDDEDHRLRLQAELPGGGVFPARLLSDGTLRFLVLAALSFVRGQRLLSIEEPENGVHPSRMGALVDLVRALATDPEFDLDYEDTVRQVLVNTHSPDFVESVYHDTKDAILVATQSMIAGPFGEGARILRLDPLIDTWRASPENRGIGVLPLMHYLRKGIPAQA